MAGESLISELKRRNVFKVATAYVVLAWVVVQVTDQAVDAFNMPEWVNTVVFFFGLIGFPFVMIFAWAFELTPEGIKREREVDRDESITEVTGKKLNTFIISLLVVALAYFIYESRFQSRLPTETVTQITQSSDRVLQNPSESQSRIASSDRKNTEEADISLKSLPGASIAVLPFVNMSSDPEQEFFSDGISEEILNVLAQIPNLHVTSRSSAFSFKGKEIIVSDVAQKLGVANVLEGSVRKAGNKIRITAQLIEADTDKHLWSETYDRELTNVFEIQDEISQAIVDALKEKLNIKEDLKLKATIDVNPDAHIAYLKGRSLLERRNQSDLELAIAEFEKAIDIDPNYAKAWMGKAWAITYLSEGNYGDIPDEIAIERASKANEFALQLNPDLAESYALKGTMLGIENKFEEAAKNFEKAISLNPNFVYSYIWYAGSLDSTKPESQSKRLELRQKSYQLDPLNVLTLVNYSYSLIDYGEFEQALSIAEQVKLINPNSHLAYEIEENAYYELYQYGKAVYASRRSHQISTNISSLFSLSFGLMRLGLVDDAVAIVEGTEMDLLKHGFRNNYEAFINQARLTLPRSEDDSFGNFRRGVAETMAGNCPDAIKFFSKSYCNRCEFLLYCYNQVGAIDAFEEAMSIRDEQIESMKKANMSPHRYDGFEQSQYRLRGDMDEFMRRLFVRLEKGYIMGHGVRHSPLDDDIREHQDYAKALEISEINRLRELAIYQDLVAAEAE